MSRSAWLAAGSLALGVLASFAGCSLGLDESLIHAVDGGGGTSDAPTADTLPPGDGPSAPDASSCAVDTDCKGANACLTGKCDATKHCTFTVCPTSACHAAACDTATKTCSLPVSFTFHTTAIAVSTGKIGCGGAVGACFAASYPFVFVGTSNGVVAYQVTDPTSASPPQIPLAGLPFLPRFIQSSGARVYFVGDVVGTGPDYKIPIAWLDPPTDPTVATLVAHTAFLTIPSSYVSRVFPADALGLFLEDDDSSKFFPASLIVAPLQDTASITLYSNGGTPLNSNVVAANGNRLVTYRWDNTSNNWDSSFSVEDKAGTGNAQNNGEKSVLAAMGPTYPGYGNAFASGPDNSLLWSTLTVAVTDGGNNGYPSVRVAWLLNDAKATNVDATANVDVETYPGNLGVGTPILVSPVVGPLVWVDAKTALVLTAAKENTAQTAVQVASRAGAKPSVIAGRRYVLPVSPGQTAAASSNGYGYVLTSDPLSNGTVHIFAPGCGP